MFLKITSPDKIVFQGEIESVVVPTEEGEIGVLPGHMPLSSVVTPGIVKVTARKADKDLLRERDFLFKDDNLFVSVSRGLVFVDGDSVVIVTSAATKTPGESQEVLEKMKKDLEKNITTLRAKGSIEDLEKAVINLQKVSADLKLFKYKGIVK
ncbi:MAG: F0F1 ATP synthase subunit epsilon [Candidatus Absconditabacteria bacterium]